MDSKLPTTSQAYLFCVFPGVFQVKGRTDELYPIR